MNESWLTNASANRLKQSYVQGFVDVSGNVIVRNGSVNIKTGKLYIPQGDISMNGNIICAGSISLGTTAGSGYQMTVNGNTRIKNSILVDNDASIMSSLGVGKASNDTYPLDVNGIARFSSNVAIGGDATINNTLSVSGISMLSGNVGVGAAPSEDDKLYVNGMFRTAGQSLFDTSVAIGPEISRETDINGSVLVVKAPITSTAVSDVTFNVPTNLYTSIDKTNAALTNKLVIDTKNHAIKPSIENDGVPMTDVANGWDLGATGANSFNRVYGRSLEVSKNAGIGKSFDAGYAMDISGATRLSSDLSVGGAATLGTITNVSGTSQFTGAVGIGKSATSDIALDISGVTMVSGNTYLAKSLVVGSTTPSTATLHVNASANIATNSVVLEGPNVLFKGQSSENLSHTNYLAIDTKTRSILPYAQDGTGTTLNSMETGWNLGGAGVNRFSKIYGRDLEISTNTIKIEDDSGNQISMGFDATTGAVNYTVTTISGEVFVIKGVQTQKISSGAGTIDPSMLEFTGLSFGDTFISDAYDLTTTFTYNLGTTTYTGNGTTFASSSGTQTLNSFVTGTNLTTLLALVPTGTSVVIKVGATDGRSAHLEDIDVEGSLVSLVNKIISVKKTGASTSKWTLWNSDGYQNVAGNFLHFIELKNINMASGTYFVAKTAGSLTYNIVDQQYLKTTELTIVNGDLYLYITRGPGNNWTKIPVSLPQSGSIQTQHVANSAITTAKLADNSVTGAKLVDGSITGVKFTDNSITTAKIADGNVTSAKLADGSISGTKLATGAIGSASMIADGIITGAKLVAGAIGTSLLASSAVTTDKLDTGTVTTDKIADLSISTSKIADGAITSAKLAPDSVSSSNIIAGSITGDRLGYLTIINDNLAAGLITTSKLEAGAVTSTILDASSVTIDKIASGSVATAKIADLAVTTGKLNATSVTTAKIASGAITSDKLASGSVASVNIIDGAITTAKISNYAVTADQIAGAAITTGKIDNYAITDLKLNAGSVTTVKIVNDSITTAKIADFSVTTFKLADAAVGTNQIAASAVTSAKIGNSEVSTAKLADGAATTAKIGDGAVTMAKLATGSVTAAKIAAAAVETDMIADGAVTSAKLGNGIVGTTNIADLSITSSKLTTQSVTTSKIVDGAITGSKIADASITTAKLAFDISNPNAASTTEPGTYTGSFADTEVVSYNVNLGLSDNTSRISADALTLASCNLYGTTATNNLNRIRIHRRKTTSDSWPTTTAADSSYNILLYGVSKNGFDMDSTGTVVYADTDNNSGMMTIYNPTENRASYYPTAKLGYNLKLDTSGNRVAMLNQDSSGKKVIEIYDVKKTFQASATRILRGTNVTYSTNGTSWTTSSNSALNVSINKVHYSEELGLWMAVGEGTSHNVATSTDGITWTGKGKVFSVKGNGVFYKNGMWVVVGEDISAVKNYAYSLDNGTTWLNPVVALNTPYLNDVLYAFGRWWVCGRITTVSYSLDGITWTGANTGSLVNIGNGAPWGEVLSLNYAYGVIYTCVASTTFNWYIYMTESNNTFTSTHNNLAIFTTNVGPAIPAISTTSTSLHVLNVFVKKMAHANGTTVAVGFGGSDIDFANIAVSTDRNSWARKKIFAGAGIDIIHDGSRWIATGEDPVPANRIQCSVDGMSWQPLTLATIANTVTTTILNLPDKTKTLHSIDGGTTWTTTTNTVLNISVNKVYYSSAANLWMAVGEGTSNTVATSPDGITWTGKGNVFNIRGNSVFHKHGIWMVVGEDTSAIKNVAYSTDNGTTWLNPSIIMFHSNANDVIHFLGKWFICGRGNYIYWSNDGTTWNTTNRLGGIGTEENTGFCPIVNYMHVTNTLCYFEYILVAENGTPTINFGNYYFFTTTIASGVTSSSIFSKKMVYANGVTMVVGYGGMDTDFAQISISNDRATWYKKKLFTGVGIDITHDGTKWIATGEDIDPAKTVQYSTDNGATWLPLILPTVIAASTNITNMITVPDKNTTLYSTNGGTIWNKTTNSVLNISVNKIHYSKQLNLWMAVGEGTNDTLATSTDGITWTGKGKVFNIRGNGVYYKGGRWLAVGEDTTQTKNVAYSNDNGTTWLNPVQTTTIFTSYGLDVIYGLGRWWICGRSTYVWWSYDGITWTTTNRIQRSYLSDEIYSFSFISDKVLYLNSFDIYTSYIYLASYEITSDGTPIMSGYPSVWSNTIGTGLTSVGNTIYTKKMAFANGYTIAVGIGGNGTTSFANVSISTDRNTWTRKKIFTGAGIDIVYDGTKWIATGEDVTPTNRIQYSTNNGTTWTPLVTTTIDVSANIINMLSIPDKNKVLSSTDGTNWTVTDNTVLNVSINKVYYSKVAGLWVAVGEGTSHTLATSTDGITWTGRGKVFNIRGNSVYHNGARWLAVGEDTNNIKNIAYSTDGITWLNPSNTVYSSYANDVIYAYGRWFVCGRSIYVYWSFDGITWNTANEVNRLNTSKDESFSLSFLANQIWVGSTSNISSVLYFDGLTTVSINYIDIWYTIIGSVAMPANSMRTSKLAHANGYTIAVGFGATSTTTIANVAISTIRGSAGSWTQKKIFTGSGLDIVYDGTKWIATGEDIDPAKRIQYSIDNGTTWTPLVTPTIASTTTTTILSLPDKNKIVYSSDNGTNWTVTNNTVLNVSINKVYYSKALGLWVAVGEGTSDTLATSTDGITWTGRGKVFNIRGNSVYHNGVRWLAVGEDTNNIKNIAYSSDGITWLNPSNTVYSTYVNDVTYAFGRWFICGRSFYVYWSFDGITWNTANEANRNNNGKDESFSFSFIGNWLWVGSTNFTYNFITFDGLTTISYYNGGDSNSAIWYSTLGSIAMPANSMRTSKLAHANGYTIAVGFGATSTTTIANVAISITRGASGSWTQKKIFTGIGLDIVYDGTKWIATGEDIDPVKRIQFSVDNGTTWAPLDLPTIAASTTTTTILSLPDKNKIVYSIDNGTNWTVANNTILNVSINKVYYSKATGMWIAVGEGTSDTLATSTDGITWTGRGKVFNIRGNSVYHNGVRWLAVGEDTNNIKNIAYSSDGITWLNPSNTVYSTYVNDVTYAFGRWFLCGRSFYVYWSFDGITWNTANEVNRTSTGKDESFSLSFLANQIWVGSTNCTYNYIYFDGLTTISYYNGGDSNSAIWYSTLGSVAMPANSMRTSKLAHANGYTIAVGFGATSTTTIANVAISITRGASSSWTQKKIFTGIGLDIVYDGTKWIATGEDIDPVKRIQFSVDNGTTWTPLVTPTIASTTTTTILSLPDKNKIVYSIDNGTNWTVANNTVLNVSINKVYYSKATGMWIAVGEGTSDTLATSTDGITWTGRGKVFNIRGNSVYHNGVRWLAVGEDTNNIKNIAYSSDGITWLNPSNTVYNTCVNDVTYAFGRWFLCGRSPYVYWSFDGITWNTTTEANRNSNAKDESFSFSFIGNWLWVGSTNCTYNYIYFDGLTTISYYNGGDSNSAIWYSTLGSVAMPANSMRTSKLAHANGYTIAVGFGATSTTTIANVAISVFRGASSSWTQKKIFTGIGLDIVYDGTKWIATGEDIDPVKRIQYSVDNGTTWLPLVTPTIAASTTTTTILSLPDKNKIVYSSDNGTNWTVANNTVLNVSINKVYYSKAAGMWIAVGEGTSDTLATSTDGITWTGRGNVFNIRGNSVYHNGVQWLAVGEDTNSIKNIAYSTDGITWSNPINTVFINYANDVIYAFGRWFICGRSNYIYWSFDGITWNTANGNNRLTATRDETYSFSLLSNYLYLNGITVVNMFISYDGLITVTYGTASNVWSNVVGSLTMHGNTISVRKMAYANGYTIAVGYGSDGTTFANISITVNRLSASWTRRKIFTGEGLDIIFDGAKWIATGEDTDPAKRIQYSTDNGTTWAPLTLPSITAPTPTTSVIVVTDTTGTNYSFNSGTTTTWTASSNLNSIFTVSINKIYYSETANLWMAAGEGTSHTLATSADGITWTGIGKTQFSVRGNSVHYKAGIWFAVGQDSSAIKNVAYSSDSGTTWSNPSITLYSVNANDVIYAFGRWLVCGKGANTTDGGYVYWSINGTTWNTTNRVAFTKDEIFGLSLLNNIVYMHSTDIYNSYIVFTSDTNTLVAGPAIDVNYSVFAYNNGTITMTAATTYVKKMAYANGYTIAVGYGGMTTSVANIAIAIDRHGHQTWIRKKIFTGAGTDIVYDGTKWIATGEDTDPTKRVQYSIDNGTTWTALNLPTMTASAKITLFTPPTFTNTLFTTAISPNVLFNASIKGISMFAAPVLNSPLYNIVRSRDIRITNPVVKSDNILYNYKLDDKSRPLYHVVPTPDSNLYKLHNIAPANIVAMGTGTNTMSYSRNHGSSWIGLGTSIFSVAGNRVFNNDSLWVAVGEGVTNTLAISTDGINWTGKGMIFGVRGKSVTYANGMWVAVGEDAASNKCIAYSTNNGVTWLNPASSVISTYCNDVTYSDVFGWIVVGKGTVNNFATSPNCVTWTGTGLVMTTEINSVAYGGSGHICIGGQDTNLNRCFLYNISTPTISWQTHNNWQGWTVKVDRVTYSPNNGGYYTIASNGSSITLSRLSTANSGFGHYYKVSQTVRCGGVAQGPIYWISWGDNSTATVGNLKISYDFGPTWYQLNYSPLHTAYNDVYIKSRPNKLLTINLDTAIQAYMGYSWLQNISGAIGQRHSQYKMAFSGDGTTVAVTASYLSGRINVFKINYTTNSYVLDYIIDGAGNNYYMGRDITLNYDGTVMAYSYGSDIADTSTQQIPRVVVYSKTSGVWNTLPDVTLKGSDYYEYSDFVPVRKFIVGFGSTLKLDKEGTTLVISSWKEYSWAGMRVFKKRSGTWLPYYTDVQSTSTIMSTTSIVNDLDITDNGQIVTWNIAEQTYVVTIPNSAIYTNVKLAPMSGATAYLDVGQDTTAYDSEYGLASDWFNAIETNGRIYAYPKSTTLTHSKEFSVQARNHLSFYTGVALLDTALANDNNSSKLRMYIDNNGLVGIGKKSTIYKLDVNGSINASGGIYSSGNLLTTSDDRLKDNEQFIDNATSTIMKLRPEIYDKKTSFDATDNNYTKESGIIAQEVWYKTPELRHLVSLGTKVDGTKTVSEETKVPVNTLSKNADSYINEHGKRVYTVAGQIVKYEDIQNESKFETVITQHDVPNVVQVKPGDIQDIVIGDDIQTDPDYAALGWGDTPASVNYIGLIPYLIKSIQELKAEIDVLRGK